MALKPFNSVGGFSVGEVPANVILANGDITTGNANLTGLTKTYELQVTSYLSTLIPFSNGSSYLTVSNNFSYNDGSNLLTVNGNAQFNNANLGNLATANFVNVSTNVAVTDTANVGNLRTDNLLYANGQPWDMSTPGGSNQQIQFNDGNGGFGASANLTFDTATDTLTLTGSGNISGNLNLVSVSSALNLGNTQQNQLVSTSNTTVELRGGWNSSTTAIASLVAGDYANSSNWGKVSIIGNLSGNSTAQLEANVINFQVGGGGANIVKINSLAPNSTSTSTGAIVVDGGIGISGNLTVGGNIVGNISGNISGNVAAAGSNTQVQYNNANTLGASANFTFDSATNVLGLVGNLNIDGNITSSTNGNINLVPNGTGIVVIANTEGGATGIQIGDPAGNLQSNAVTLTNSTSVSNALVQLNTVLGKLVPPSPTNFPSGVTLSVNSLSTYRMANFTQTDNTPGANKSVAGGTTVTTVRRASSYATNTVANRGPGDQGTIAVYLNGADAGNRTLTSSLNGNGTYSNLVITNNVDYNTVNANIAAGFWSVFTAYAAGTVTQGWNEVKITDSATSNTNMPSWYYDASAPGTPQVSNASITAPGSPSYTYSSTVAHYNSSNPFIVAFDVNRLSGDMYPTSDTFITGTAGGAFAAPVSLTYANANVTTPLARNLYVSSGNASVSTTANIISGFGASTGSPSVSVLNSYATGTGSFSPGANVLYKTGTASTMEESNVVIGGSIGSGSGLAFRIINPGSSDTPTFTASAAAFNSQSSTLQTYDATIVAAILKHDITNYSTGYLPVGPDLSSGRGSAQYFTFKFVRTSVSKFDVRWTGTIAGLWVALPGSTIDSTSGLNGWLSMSTAYGGAGVPGSNTGAGGNGSDGCALGGVAPLNSAQTNKSVTATFGTVSSSSTATNEIYVRIKLTSGQSVTALSLQPASN
jgi:hypothetical protein